MERNVIPRFTARILAVGLIAVPLLASRASAQEAEPTQIPYVTHLYSPDSHPHYTQQLGDSIRKIYAAINADRLIDEVHLADRATLDRITGTDCVSAARTTEDGVNQVYFDRYTNPRVLSVVRSALHEYNHHLDPNRGSLKRFGSSEEIGRLGILRELAVILPYDRHYLSQGRTFGRGDAWALGSSTDPMTRIVRAYGEVWAEVGERSFLDEPIPSEFDEMRDLHARIHHRVSGQTVDESKARLKVLFEESVREPLHGVLLLGP